LTDKGRSRGQGVSLAEERQPHRLRVQLRRQVSVVEGRQIEGIRSRESGLLKELLRQARAELKAEAWNLVCQDETWLGSYFCRGTFPPTQSDQARVAFRLTALRRLLVWDDPDMIIQRRNIKLLVGHDQGGGDGLCPGHSWWLCASAHEIRTRRSTCPTTAGKGLASRGGAPRPKGKTQDLNPLREEKILDSRGDGKDF